MGKNEKKKKKNSTQERRRLWNPPPHICPGTAGEHTLAVFEAVSSAVCVMEVCLTDFSVREPTFDIHLQFLAAGSWPEKDKMYQSVFLSLNGISFPSEIKGNIKFCYSKQYCSTSENELPQSSTEQWKIFRGKSSRTSLLLVSWGRQRVSHLNW